MVRAEFEMLLSLVFYVAIFAFVVWRFRRLMRRRKARAFRGVIK